ncbi:hypothetical protein MPER_01794 [Moniliophthora perniciosa FA553]|nr:hypothetical protein MPER_01794 [Moniliophthora perniciosa FA553]
MQLYPTGSPTKHLARRFSYANIDPIANRDLGVAAVTKQTSTAINQNFIPQAATPDEDPRNEHHLSDCRRSVASALGSLSDSERNPNSPVVAPGEDSRSEQPMTLGGRKRSAPDQLDYDRKLKRIMGNFTNSDGNREAQKPTKEQKFTIPATLRSLLENLPDRNTYSGPVIDANEMLTVLKTMSFSKSITGGI